jgi:hypothetical protein
MRLDISGLPPARITYSPDCRINAKSSPLGVDVRPSNSQGTIGVNQ